MRSSIVLRRTTDDRGCVAEDAACDMVANASLKILYTVLLLI
jgi:hypothetical protein